MQSLDILKIEYNNSYYHAVEIPDIFTGDSSRPLLIGANSLNTALYNDAKGYADAKGQYIDEQVYAFVDDEFFSLSYPAFLSKVRECLD